MLTHTSRHWHIICFIALRIVALGEQPVYEADSFDGFTVINRARLDAGFLLELLENRLRKNFVLGCVNDDDLRSTFATAREGQDGD